SVCPFHPRCLEGMASAPALARRLGCDPASISDDHPVWNLEADYLAHGVAAAVLAIAPQRVVLGGGVLKRGILLRKIHASVIRLLAGYIPRPELSSHIDSYIVLSNFKDPGLMGAFAVALGSGRP